MYCPAGVEDDVRAVRVEDPVPPREREMVTRLKFATMVVVAGEIAAERLTLPLRPLLESVRLKLAT